ncbi:lipocalin-like domain-containing protein [Methylobacterium sp. P31]
MRVWVLAVCFALSAQQGYALDQQDLVGTWNLVSAKNKILDTGEVVDAYGGPNPKGWTNYGSDGRMMVACAYDQRRTPENKDLFSDQDRILLQKTFFAYAGTYTFDGSRVTHNIDTSSDQIWTGLHQVRNVEEKNGKLIYTNQPQINTNTGQKIIVTSVWERYPPVPDRR